MQRAAFAAAGLPASYDPLEVHPDDLGERVEQLRRGLWRGFNVTIPHKVAALELADDPDPLARRIGAANTLWCEHGTVRASNTDITAMRAVIAAAGITPSDPVLLIGAGGAARAALLALTEFEDITLLNRTVANANALAQELAPQARVLSLADPSATAAGAAAAFIINASSVGMAGGPAPQRTPLAKQAFGGGQVAFDMVYRPLLTPMLAAARQAGARTIDGLAMLVLQGAASFAIWTGLDPDVAAMRNACERAL